MTTDSHKIFIVEDDPVYIKLIKYVFEMNPDFEIHVFQDGKSCIDQLYLNPSIVSLDYRLPDMKGVEVMEKIKAFNEQINVIVLSGQGDIDTAIELLKKGAYDYIVKNKEAKDRLMTSINHLQKTLSLKEEVENLKTALNIKYDIHKLIIGNSKSINTVYKLIDKAIKTNITVSVTGETGSGKELVAKSIHYNSPASKNAFVAVNVSAIPKTLIESELFGYEKGAFTGAETRKLGQFELANNGTLFLDEIAELDISVQSKLLRALQEKEIMRIGGESPIKFNARIIVATHKDLVEEVSAGRFREDLYYRLLGLPIQVPPLRERGNDVLLLMRHFLTDFAKTNSLGKISVSKEAKEKLLSYTFPGNVRELKAIIELAAVLCEENHIESADIRFSSLKQADAFLNNNMTLKEYNKKIVHYYLDQHDNDVLAVARILDIGKSTIYRMLKDDPYTAQEN